MWLKQEAQEQLKSRLRRQGFEITTPAPNLAWRVFKEFVQTPPTNWRPVSIGVEFLHLSDRDNDLWLEFACHFEDGNGDDTNMSCEFTHEVPIGLERINKGLWWSPEFGDLSAFFDGVEEMPEFKACMALGAWNWE